MNDRLERALAAIDALHARDPAGEELAYAEHMTAALALLNAAPSEALQLAVRAQHLCRWELPRASYPEGRAGYLRWRAAQSKLHSSLARETVAAAGYDAAVAARVADLVRKRDVTRDPEAQTLEDAACLVFLEHHLPAFARGRERAAVLEVLRKTWPKMSETGQRAALELRLPPESKALLTDALAERSLTVTLLASPPSRPDPFEYTARPET